MDFVCVLRLTRRRLELICYLHKVRCLLFTGLVHFRTLVTLRRVRVRVMLGLELRLGLVRVRIRVRIRLGLDLGLGLG